MKDIIEIKIIRDNWSYKIGQKYFVYEYNLFKWFKEQGVKTESCSDRQVYMVSRDYNKEPSTFWIEMCDAVISEKNNKIQELMLLMNYTIEEIKF